MQSSAMKRCPSPGLHCTLHGSKASCIARTVASELVVSPRARGRRTELESFGSMKMAMFWYMSCEPTPIPPRFSVVRRQMPYLISGLLDSFAGGAVRTRKSSSGSAKTSTLWTMRHVMRSSAARVAAYTSRRCARCVSTALWSPAMAASSAARQMSSASRTALTAIPRSSSTRRFRYTAVGGVSRRCRTTLSMWALRSPCCDADTLRWTTVSRSIMPRAYSCSSAHPSRNAAICPASCTSGSQLLRSMAPHVECFFASVWASVARYLRSSSTST
mmetsp:Transcript_6657/g.20902  ORF Transcript_6657/g.20902 Transcript_6657/m.20902 type:complete len:274 (-) Transcript_6657:240-1061(-)